MTDSPAPACAGCQAALRPGAVFCGRCGRTTSAVDEEAPGPPPDNRLSAPRFAAHWGDIKRVGALFALLLASSFAASLGGAGPGDSPMRVLVIGTVDAAIVLGFALSRPGDILPLLGLPRLSRRQAAELLGLGALFVAGLSGYFALIERAGVPLLHAADAYRQQQWPLWSVFLTISLMPAVFEELAFRGVIQSSLGQVLGVREALFIQAALFSVLHLMPLMFPSHFAMGLCFGYMRLRSGSLYPGMCLHAAWNAWVVYQELGAG